VTDTPPPVPPYQPPPPPVVSYQTDVPPGAPPQLPPADRIRNAWHARSQSDYIFNFATALGWTLLSCGFYTVYVVYQLMRRDRDHNLRRIELLDAATTFAWQEAHSKNLGDELRPSFDRINTHMTALRGLTTQFRDPGIWAIITLLARNVGELLAFIFIDMDLVTHDYAEGAIEYELAAIYTRLGTPVAMPDPNRLKARHNYVGRVIAALLTCGIYTFWWEYDVMTEGNRHFQANWAWEDSLANAVQQLMAA
jgi:hypothetical protein